MEHPAQIDLEALDARVFASNFLGDEANREAFQRYLSRWQRALNERQRLKDKIHAVELLEVMYTNYKSIRTRRFITPQRVYFGKTEYHPEPQWLMEAFDHIKKAHRTFALKDMELLK